MTPYVDLQIELIRTFKKILEESPKELKTFAKKYCAKDVLSLSAKDLRFLKSYGLTLPEDGPVKWVMEACLEIIKQQITFDGRSIVIRNLLGTELYHNGGPIGYEEYIRNRGSGHNLLRTMRFSHPGVLKNGDVLANGDRLLSPPREGGNGAVLLHLTGGFDGHWISVPARIPIALLTKEDGAPPELVEK